MPLQKRQLVRSRLVGGSVKTSGIRVPTTTTSRSVLGAITSAVPRMRPAKGPDLTEKPQYDQVGGFLETRAAQNFSGVMLDVAFREHERETILRAKDAFFDFEDKMRDLEVNFLQLEGKEAVDSYRGYQVQVEEFVKKSLESVDDYTKTKLLDMLGPARNQYLQQGARHTLVQKKQWEDNTRQETVVRSFNKMPKFWHDPVALKQHIDESAEMIGFTNEADRIDYVNKAYKTAADMLLIDDENYTTEQAMAFIKSFDHEMGAADLVSTEKQRQMSIRREMIREEETDVKMRKERIERHYKNTSFFITETVSGRPPGLEWLIEMFETDGMDPRNTLATIGALDAFENRTTDKYMYQQRVKAVMEQASEQKRKDLSEKLLGKVAAAQLEPVVKSLYSKYPELEKEIGSASEVIEGFRKGDIKYVAANTLMKWQSSLGEIQTDWNVYIDTKESILRGERVQLEGLPLNKKEISVLANLIVDTQDDQLREDIKAAEDTLKAYIVSTGPAATIRQKAESISLNTAVTEYREMRKQGTTHTNALNQVKASYADFKPQDFPPLRFGAQQIKVSSVSAFVEAVRTNETLDNNPYYERNKHFLNELHMHYEMTGELESFIEESRIQRKKNFDRIQRVMPLESKRKESSPVIEEPGA
jgi:hypothetical protein